MVAKSYLKSILRSVGSSFSRFLAIFFIVALGVGFLAGLLSATPDMRHSVDVYYKETNFMDLQVIGTLGLGEYDIKSIRDLPFVTGVMPSVTSDLIAVTPAGDSLVTRVHSVDFSIAGGDPGSINRGVLVDGRWPNSADECVVETEGALSRHFALGDEIYFTPDNKDLEDLLGINRFTVVGVVTNSYYLNMSQRGYTSVGNGKLAAIAYLPAESFVTDYYTEAYVTVSGGQDTAAFEYEYTKLADSAALLMENHGDNQKYVRSEALRYEAEDKLNEAKATLDEKTAEAEAELADALKKLEDGQRQLDEAGQELFDGQVEYDKGVADLATAKAEYADEIADAERQIAEAEALLEDARQELADGWAEYEDGRRQLEDNRPQLEDGRRQLEEAIAEFEAAEAEIEDGERRLADGKKELADGRRELAAAAAQLEDAKRQLADGWAEINRNQALIDENKAQLEDGQSQLDALAQAITLAEDNKEALEYLMEQAGQHSPQEAIDQAEAFLKDPENTARVDQIRADMAAGREITAADRAFLALYESTETILENSEELLQQLEELQQQYQSAQDVIDGLQQQYDDGLRQLEDGQRQLDEAQAQLDDGRRQLEDGQREYQDGLRQYQAGLAELEDGESQLEDSEALLADGRLELEKNRPQLEEAKAEFAESEALFLDNERLLDDALQQLEEGQAEYDDGMNQLEENRQLLEDGRQTAQAEFARAERRLQDAKVKLEDGRQQLADGRLELEDGWEEYNKGQLELEEKLLEARDEITAAEDKLRDLDDPKWYVLTRESNPGYVSYRNDSDKIEAIARVFPVFFFLVATLVASTTMTRMVEEERGNIGTLKALGYGNGAIAAKFFAYATLAAALGSAAGLVIGLNLFPSVIYNAYGMMYNLPALNPSKHIIYGTISTGAIYIGIMLATGGALKSSLQENAASLMRPKAPKEGKRIFLERIGPLWRRMKFTHKVTARNLIRYKKRFFMTVVGIFGCTALLLCGFGLRDSISDIVNLQFGDIFTYNISVTIKHDGDQETDPRIRRIMDDPGLVNDYAAMHMETSMARTGKGSFEVSVVCPQDISDLAGYVNLRVRTSGAPVAFDESSVIITEKAASALEIGIGDTFLLENSDGTVAQLAITGIAENYVQGYIYMSPQMYEQAFDTPCQYTTLLGHLATEDRDVEDGISTSLLASPNVTGVSFTAGLKATFDEMLETIDFIVVVLIVSAGLLAFVVMYNLTNINITERQKEIATLKVLGFNAMETAAYIFRETTILAVVGALVGLVGGIFLHGFVVRTAEVDNMMFGRIIAPVSYVLSFFITLGFSAIVNLVMSVKLKKISMADSLKAPE